MQHPTRRGEVDRADLQRTASLPDCTEIDRDGRLGGPQTARWSAASRTADDGVAQGASIDGQHQDDGRDGQRPDRLDTNDRSSPDDVAALREELRGLQQRQLTQATIEQAKGMLMGYYGISADTAFTVLTRWSQSSNTKVRDIAAAFVAAGAQPSSEPFGAVRAALRTHNSRGTARTSTMSDS
jgi:ANTAR domain